jgi:DNA-directed RNA polymerase specialized sigma24 family protein
MKQKESLTSISSEGRPANPDEVNGAFEALTENELLVLKIYAASRVTRLRVAAGTRTDEDLLHDAFVAALTGERTWIPGRVDFVRFMLFAMRSISNGWVRMYRRRDTISATDLIVETESGVDEDPLGAIPSSDPSPEELAHAELLKRRLEAMMGNDPIRCGVLEAKMAGFGGDEIPELLDISKQQYDAARQYIHRLGLKLVGELGSYEWKRE